MYLGIALLAAVQLLGFAAAIVPAPVSFTNGTSVVWITPSVQTVLHTSTHQRRFTSDIRSTESHVQGPSDAALVQAAFGRFKDTLKTGTYVPWKFYPRGAQFEPAPGSGSTIHTITVTLGSNSTASPASNSTIIDESYSLDVTAQGSVNIAAATAQGAMHALVSLQQLFYQTSKGGAYYSTMAPVSIKDKPRFSWRGLNIDIARNFESPQTVMRLIDGLALNKFNKLHIHATDSQSWPLELPTMPQTSAKGAYTPSLVWSAQDLANVQQYAVARGIQPIVEIDSPGHTASLAYSQPDLIAAFNQQPWPTYCNEPPCGQAKLNNAGVTDFFNKLAKDLYPRVSPYTAYFHSGGDELNANVYALDPDVGSNETSVIVPYLQKFVDNVHKNIRAAGLTPIVWEEMLLTWNLTLPKDVVIQTWLSNDSVKAAADAGHPLLFGEYSWWYLDCGFGQWVDPNVTAGANTPIVPPYTDYCNPYKSWREILAYDPLAPLTTAEEANVLGGEAHMWGELTDASNLDGKVWPRASAAAELLWAGPHGVAGVNETVTRRLADMRERMVGLGFAPSVVQMTWCLQNIGSCSE